MVTCSPLLSGILDTLEGVNALPIQRVARDVPVLAPAAISVPLNTTLQTLGALLQSH